MCLFVCLCLCLCVCGLPGIVRTRFGSPHTATQCNTVYHSATQCNTLQHTATHCNTLQPSATHCNTLQHTCCSQGIAQALLFRIPLSSGDASRAVLGTPRALPGVQPEVQKKTSVVSWALVTHHRLPEHLQVCVCGCVWVCVCINVYVCA